VQLVQSLHVEDDDLCEQRQSLAHRQRLVQLLVVLDEDDAAVRIVREVVHLLGRVRWVDAARHAAAREHGEIAQHPFEDGVGEDGRGVPSLEAQRHQAARDLARRLAHLRPGPGLPQAELFLAQPHLVSARGHGVPEHRGDGLAGHGDALA